MVSLVYGKISAINYGAGTAGITLEDKENQVIQDVPFLAAFYEMPRIGDTVAAVFDETGGQIGKGIILGKIFLSAHAGRTKFGKMECIGRIAGKTGF